MASMQSKGGASTSLAWSKEGRLCEGKTSDAGIVTRQGQESRGR